MTANPVSLSAYGLLLRTNRNFRLLWLAQIVSELGDWLYSVAVYSLLFEYTGSAKSVATAFVLQVLPQFFIAPAAGVINDRLSRKKVMIFADCFRAVIVLGMLLVRGPEMIWFLYILLLLETCMWALFEPGRNAVIPNITTGKEVIVANTLSSMTWSFNLAIGAALGGAIAVLFGRTAVFLVNGLTFVVSALVLRRMEFSEPHLATLPPLRMRDLADFTPILDGIRYVKHDARLLATMFVKCGLGLMGSHWVILPVLGERIFPVRMEGLDPQRGGMLGMSLLMASRGVGALLGPIVGSYWSGRIESRLRLGILIGFLTGSLGYLLLSAAGSLWIACATVVLAYAGGSVIWVFSTTLLQIQTADRFRGRVFSAEFAFGMLAMSTVSYTSGVLIDVGLTPQELAAYTGLIILIPAAAWAFALRLWKKPCPVPDHQDS
ncbi:MAG: MFS transporter [Bryobacteraceae bacterium]|nr:MFS transporter [Bryobacterales bacterium]MEB2359884.1 MFS transporter [Bryobacterales bacterium]NUN00801.1 MFS transporter [Bryobacteraceae bacterium]